MHMGTTGLLHTRRAPPILIPHSIEITLITGDHKLKLLSEQTDKNISHFHFSISFLENQVGTLCEVVLQNCHGLNIIFIKEEGLCMACGETCAFMPTIQVLLKGPKENLKGMSSLGRRKEIKFQMVLITFHMCLVDNHSYKASGSPDTPVLAPLCACCIINDIAGIVQEQVMSNS